MVLAFQRENVLQAILVIEIVEQILVGMNQWYNVVQELLHALQTIFVPLMVCVPHVLAPVQQQDVKLGKPITLEVVLQQTDVEI